MQDYTDYAAEDFAQDDHFIRWVTFAEIETETFWQNWLETYPFKRAEVEAARQLVIITRHLPQPEVSAQDIAAMRNSVFERIISIENPVAERQTWWLARHWLSTAAAVAAIALLAGWFILQNESANETGYKTQITEAAHKQDLIEVVNLLKESRLVNLPDGSSVILKKGSKLSYPGYFQKNRRDVYLTGEAFFEIAKDADKPFYVFANEIVTKVLGTSFTVKAFPEDAQVTVAVKTGKVSVFQSESKGSESHFQTKTLEGMVLAPNEQAVFAKGNRLLSKMPALKNIPSHQIQDIRHMQFEYEETPVSQILEELQKAYKITIVYDHTVIGDCPVTASLTDEPLSEKLSLLCKAVRSGYEIVNGEIVITGKGCK